jgi:plastocyanin
MLTRTRRLLLAAATLTLTGASVLLPVAPSAHAAMAHDVAVNNRMFTPKDMTIAVGDTITWTNGSAEDHNIRGGPIVSGVLKPGTKYSLTFDKAGLVKYTCDIHPTMNGSVRITQ